MANYTLVNDSGMDVAFAGTLLGEVSQGPTTLRLYEVAVGGGIICERIVATSREVHVCRVSAKSEKPQRDGRIRDFFGHGTLAKQLYAMQNVNVKYVETY